MAVILAYHRVAPPERDPFGLCVTPAHFDEHMEHLRRRCRPLPLLDLVGGALRGDLPAGAVAVTLDDGYSDALSSASPTLARFEVPATFFVTTMGLDEPRAYWWDVLARVLTGPHQLPPTLDMPGLAEGVATATAGEREAALRVLHGHLLPLAADERDARLARIVAWSGSDVQEGDACRPMTAEELSTLAGRAGHAIGCHSAHHLLLPRQEVEVQRGEVLGSKARLDRLLARPVEAFCYPFGAWDEITLAVVREAGFRAAVTVREAPVDHDDDALLLPRVEIGDCDGESFARRLWPLL